MKKYGNKLVAMSSFDKFLKKFVESFSGKEPMIFSVLGNVFSMRIIGNKTHGDLAEIALTEYINQFIDGFTAKHTGKEKFRAKEFEEDIRITETITKEEIPISIKTYGFGPLQLSTNKDVSMFSLFQKEQLHALCNFPSRMIPETFLNPEVFRMMRLLFYT